MTLICLYCYVRLTYAAARDGTFPEMFSYIHVTTQIPAASILLIVRWLIHTLVKQHFMQFDSIVCEIRCTKE